MTKIMTLFGLSLMVLSGCADRANWVGEWRGERDFKGEPGMEDSVVYSMNLIKLKITIKGSFELTEESFGKEGSALLGADTATLTIDKMLGRRIESLGPEAAIQGGERKLTMQKDGTIRFERKDFKPVILKRIEG